MERKEIHQQISAIIDKINYLNKKLSEENIIHRVELDLLKGYHNELQDLIRNLELGVTSYQEEINKTDINEAKDETKDSGVDNRKEANVKLKERKDDIAQLDKVKEKENPEEAQAENETEMLTDEITTDKEKQEVEKDEAYFENGVESKEEKNTAEPAEPEKPSQAVISPESFDTENNDEDHVSLNEKFKMDSFELADKLKFGGRKNLKEKIDLNQRYIFIKELFEGDAEYFNKSLRELDKCKSMEEAQDYIKTAIEEKYAWEEKQKYASKFIELVLNNFDEVNNN